MGIGILIFVDGFLANHLMTGSYWFTIAYGLTAGVVIYASRCWLYASFYEGARKGMDESRRIRGDLSEEI